MLTAILIALLQGLPVTPTQSGSITGILTNSTGTPAAGVRVSAMTRPDSPLDAQTMSAMASIAETDPNGAFKLENIPPGRYYIVAGRIDQPTYYPGTLELTSGRDVLITPGVVLTGVNFALNDNSVGRAQAISGSRVSTWTVPVRVTVEGGGKVPTSGNGFVPVLRLTSVSDNRTHEVPLTSSWVVIRMAASAEYRVTIENLSTAYWVKSIVSDNVDLTSGLLRLTASAALRPQQRILMIQTVPTPGVRSDVANGTFVVVSGGNRPAASPYPPAIEITLAPSHEQR